MSWNLLVILGTIVIPAVVICFVSTVTLINAYLHIRRRFPAKVNCWFCNHDSRVPYDQSNSFVCSSCRQYNGFTRDGDYNREIPEQYQQRLNNCHYHHPTNITDDDKWGHSTVRSVAGGHPNGRVHTSNGLCFGCNRNQELKIHQLASFVPEDETNYEEEVEEYRKQLEQAYKLCGRCERVLKRTLNDVKRNILGSKLAALGSKSLNVLDMHLRESTKQVTQRKRQRWAKVCVWAITGLLLMKLPQDFANSGWTMNDLIRLCPVTLVTGITVTFSYVLAMRELLAEQYERIRSDPGIKETTERIETIGNEILHQYVPQLVETSTHYFETISGELSHERRSPLLVNVAIVALAALLASFGSQRTIIKQLFIVTSCFANCVLNHMQSNDSSSVTLLLTVSSLVISLSCIGQRLIRSDVPATNLNSSFHKIYSQQCRESDYSDTDTTTGVNQSLNQDETMPIFPIGRNEPPTSSDLSGKSLDTTKSGSPSVFSISPTANPFLTSSYADGTPTFGCGKISGSLFNVATGIEHHPIEDEKAFLFSPRRQMGPGSSLLKTPSFSVDNFQTVSNGTVGQLHRRNVRRSGPTLADGPKVADFRYSMGTIDRAEDQLIEDDIDRLSISGHASAAAMNGSRVSLTNPFAAIKHFGCDPEYDELMVASSNGLRRRPGLFRPPKDSLWTAATKPQTNMLSRTSSQSSGFESQAGTTRRNTPIEGDAQTTNCGTADTLTSNRNVLPRSQQPSPVPSSASAFQWNTNGSLFGANRTNVPLQQRSLFNEQSLFNNALQQPFVGGLMGSERDVRSSSLFLSKLSRTSTANNGPGSTASSIASARHIFPPQQSQTPSYHHQYNHNNPPTTSFGSSHFISKTSTPSLSGASFYTSSNNTARASLLKLSKLSNDINNGELPTA